MVLSQRHIWGFLVPRPRRLNRRGHLKRKIQRRRARERQVRDVANRLLGIETFPGSPENDARYVRISTVKWLPITDVKAK